MVPLIGVLGAALAAFVVFALWRGRMVSISLAGSECPDCRVPLVRVPDEKLGPRAHEEPATPAEATPAGASPRAPWEVWACPDCERVVTTVGRLPSPLAECPGCQQQSLVVYAERAAGLVVVDEWCDLCGRRGRTTLQAPPRAPVGSEPAPRGRVLPFKRV